LRSHHEHNIRAFTLVCGSVKENFLKIIENSIQRQMKQDIPENGLKTNEIASSKTVNQPHSNRGSMPKSKPKSKSKSKPEIELEILLHLEAQPNVSQRSLASEVGVSLGSVNYCLKALVEKGLVKAENFRKSANKIGYAYLLTPQGIQEKSKLTASFLKRKQAEYRLLEKEINHLRAQLMKENAK
jgi:EPS-associated MarR family transcriptional regulator